LPGTVQAVPFGRVFFDTNGQSQRLFKRTHSSVLPEVCPEGLARGLPRAQQGDLSEAAFVYKATSVGLVVAKPHGNMHPHDFIVDGGGGLWRVQVKSCARFLDRFYKVRICRRKDGVPIPYTESEIDFGMAYIISEQTWYVVPVREMLGRTSLTKFSSQRIFRLGRPRPLPRGVAPAA
jgi:hypothetical protein